VDSLRADRCFGNQKTSKTPNLDNLIKNGVYFSHAISSVASTGSSIATIFTGLYPFKLGMSGGDYQKLDPKISTYIKDLKENGYHNYSTSPELASLLGITCDFENIDKSYKNYFGLFSGLGQQILEKLEEKRFQEPWFFYIHLVDLHNPIIVPKEFDNEVYGNTQYDRMISAIDNWLGKILKKIDLINTIVVITSDHGDYVPVVGLDKDAKIDFQSSSFEKTLWRLGNRIPDPLYPLKSKVSTLLRSARHKIKESKLNETKLTPYQKRVLTSTRMDPSHHVYDDVIRVPLILCGYSIIQHVPIDQQVRSIDIFPTINQILGLPNKKRIDGRSLVPLLNDKKVEEMPAYIESMPRIKEEGEQKIGLRTSKYKYLRNQSNINQNVELYDLKNDPLEEKNIANEFPKIVKTMENNLNQIRNKKIELKSTTSDEERKKIEDELRKLGYV